MVGWLLRRGSTLEAINEEIKPQMMGKGGSRDSAEADRRIIWNSML